MDKAQIDTSTGTVHFTKSAAPAVLSWDAVRATLADLNARFGYRVQGLVIKNNESGQRYKIRTPEYNRVRRLRGNSARRDYLWLQAWHEGTLQDYVALFPEEHASANHCIQRWKQITNDVYHIYTDVFKARSLQKSSIPPKYRPLVYGMHSMYLDTLKPAGKSVDWHATLEYMNNRDTAQMLFVINWELRQATKQLGVPSIPLEPPTAVGTDVLDDLLVITSAEKYAEPVTTIAVEANEA